MCFPNKTVNIRDSIGMTFEDAALNVLPKYNRKGIKVFISGSEDKDSCLLYHGNFIKEAIAKHPELSKCLICDCFWYYYDELVIRVILYDTDL